MEIGSWTASALASIGLIVATLAIATPILMAFVWADEMLGSRAGWRARSIRRIGHAAMMAAAVLPIILHAIAWESIAGKFGWLSLYLRGGTVGGGSFSGAVATIWIHAMHASALGSVMLVIAKSRLSPSIRAAASLDYSPGRTVARVLLPMLRPAIVAWATLVTLLALTEMTVADLYMWTTIADRFYLYFAVNPDLPSVVGVMVPAIIAAAVGAQMVFTAWSTFGGNPNHDGDPGIDVESVAEARSGGLGDAIGPAGGSPIVILAGALMAVLTLLVVGVPIGSLLWKLGLVNGGDWSAIESIRRLGAAVTVFRGEGIWTAIVSTAAAAIAMVAAMTLRGIVRRSNRRSGWRRRLTGPMVHALLWGLFCVPGPVVGLTLIFVFNLPVPGFRFLSVRTIVVLLLGLQARAIPIAYVMMAASRRGRAVAPESSDPAADLRARLDLPPITRWFRHEWPMDRSALLTAMTVTIIAVTGDVAVSLRLIPPGVSLVSTRLFGLLHSGARYQEAALAVFWIAAMMTLILATTLILNRRR